MSATVHGPHHTHTAVECRPLTADEAATYANAVKAREQSIPALNDFLQRLLTLNSALIGGGFVVAKGDVLPFWCGVAVLAVLVLSLCATVFGLLPVRGHVAAHAVNGLDAYKTWETGVMEVKRRAVVGAVALLAIAFAVGVAGLAVKGPTPTEAKSTG